MTDPSIQATPPLPRPASPAASPPVTRSLFSVLLFALIFVVIHAFLWSALSASFLLYVPKTEKLFKDYALALPSSTIFVFQVGRWFANYWYILAAGFLPCLCADGILLAVLYWRRRLLGWLWALLNIVLLLLLIFLVYLAIEMARMKLMEGLSH
jgi:hypothetical protein